MRRDNHRLPLLVGKFQNSPQAATTALLLLKLIQSGPPNIHQWAGIINQPPAPQIVEFKSSDVVVVSDCQAVFVASKDNLVAALFLPSAQVYIIVKNHCPHQCIIVILYCNISLLNLAIFQGKTTGQDLLDNIYKYLNLIETAYFGLRYQDNANQTVSCFIFCISSI